MNLALDGKITSAFAPSGTLRVAVNFGNPILASRNEQGSPQGISVEIAERLAAALDTPLRLVPFDAAGKVVTAVGAGDVDVGFFAIDPIRGREIAFTDPYLLIEGNYLVRSESPILSKTEVDREGVRVAVGSGSAYDLFLTRELKSAQIIRGSTSPEVVNTFLREGLDVAAGVRQQLEFDAARLGGLRLIEDSFMVIRQAMGIGKDRGPRAADWLNAFVTQLKQDGTVAAAMRKYRITGASIAD
ncbi:ABC transporter substrate-binding protein [Caballeronia calidae]|nr:ABC transporter substrate-binding protein [Caballeronia calidae]